MRVMKTTKILQGKRKSDFCHPKDGEFALFNSECDGEAIDGKCGCRRSMHGHLSRTSTTTMIIEDDPEMTREKLWAAIHLDYVNSGWAKLMDGKALMAMVDEAVANLIRISDNFDVGTIIEKRGKSFQERSHQ